MSQGLSMTELLPVIGSKRWIHTRTLWKDCKAQGLGIETKYRAMVLGLESGLECKQKQLLSDYKHRRTEERAWWM